MIPGQAFTSTFEIKSSSGNLVNSGLLPSAIVYRNGVLTSISVTTSNLSTGIYNYNFDVPENWTIGDSIDIHLSTVVDGFTITSKINQLVSIDPSKIDSIEARLTSIKRDTGKMAI